MMSIREQRIEVFNDTMNWIDEDTDLAASIADKYGVSIAQLDFLISDEDMETLKAMKKIEDYGKDKNFPVFAKG